MSNSLDIQQLLELAKSELAKYDMGQEFLLGDVYAMTRQAYEKYREDAVIRQFAFVIEQMIEKLGNTSIIDQQKMTDIYNNLVRLSGNTKFREALGMFLLDQPVKTASNDFAKMNRIDAENSQLTVNDYIDQNLTNTLIHAFGGTSNDIKPLDNTAAKVGKEYVELELKAMGFKPRVEIIGGDSSVLVYACHVDTTAGIVSVAIPIELSSGKVLLPSTFVADDHLEELTAQKFQYFVDKKAVTKNFSMPSADSVVTAVRMLTGLQKTASTNEFKAVLNDFMPEHAEDSGEKVYLTTPELFSDKQNYPEPKAYIDTTPQVEMPKELAHLAHDFENDILEAASEYGKTAVGAGKQMVIAELAAAGFKHAQVRFGGEAGDAVIYLAAIHTPKGPTEIEIPVEMKEVTGGYIPLAPSYFGWDGIVEDFTPEKLQRFAIRRPAESNSSTVYSTTHQYMTLPELRDQIVKAASEKDYVSAEMILGTIQERFEEEDYKNAIADYHYILMYNRRQDETEGRHCALEIAAGKGSIETRCGHYMVPMSKVTVGDDGRCRLKSHIEKERLNPLDEGSAAISTSKLFMS